MRSTIVIDVLGEDLLDLKEATKAQPFRNPRTRKPAHVASIYRYVEKGARASNGQRIRLETIRTPRGLMTSRQAIVRFIEALTDPEKQETLAVPASVRRSQGVVDRELDEAGIA